MPSDFVILNLIQWLCAVLMFGLAAYSLRFRSIPPAGALLVFFSLCGMWAFFAALIPHVHSLEDKILLNRMKMLSPSLLPVCILSVAHTLHGGKPWPRWVWALCFATPLGSLLLLLSPNHEYFIGSYRLLPYEGVDLLAFTNGPWFKVHNIQARIMTIVSVLLILTARRHLNPYHKQKPFLINLAIIMPFVIDSIAVAYYEQLRYLQITPAILTASAFVLAYAIFGRNILDLIPFARSQILDHTPDLYFVFDARLRLVDLNVTAQNVFQLPQDIIGASWNQVFGPNLVEPSDSQWSKDSAYYEIIQKPLNDELAGRRGTLVIFKNVSLQKKIERELHDISQMKTKLLAVMGHDLQGSLSGLALTAENLARKVESYEPQDLRAHLETMHYSARSCVGLIDQLLIWSKSEMGVLQPSFTSFELQSLIHETLTFLQPAIVDKNIVISLNTEVSEQVVSDFNLVQTVIRNLLSNAITFTPENGTISVLIEDQGPELKISVVDSGRGIAPELEETLFEAKKDPRSGLGLYLCAEFVKRLGGRIWSESSLGRGGIFRFTIPKASRTPC